VGNLSMLKRRLTVAAILFSLTIATLPVRAETPPKDQQNVLSAEDQQKTLGNEAARKEYSEGNDNTPANGWGDIVTKSENYVPTFVSFTASLVGAYLIALLRRELLIKKGLEIAIRQAERSDPVRDGIMISASEKLTAEFNAKLRALGRSIDLTTFTPDEADKIEAAIRNLDILAEEGEQAHREAFAEMEKRFSMKPGTLTSLVPRASTLRFQVVERQLRLYDRVSQIQTRVDLSEFSPEQRGQILETLANLSLTENSYQPEEYRRNVTQLEESLGLPEGRLTTLLGTVRNLRLRAPLRSLELYDEKTQATRKVDLAALPEVIRERILDAFGDLGPQPDMNEGEYRAYLENLEGQLEVEPGTLTNLIPENEDVRFDVVSESPHVDPETFQEKINLAKEKAVTLMVKDRLFNFQTWPKSSSPKDITQWVLFNAHEFRHPQRVQGLAMGLRPYWPHLRAGDHRRWYRWLWIPNYVPSNPNKVSAARLWLRRTAWTSVLVGSYLTMGTQGAFYFRDWATTIRNSTRAANVSEANLQDEALLARLNPRLALHQTANTFVDGWLMLQQQYPDRFPSDLPFNLQTGEGIDLINKAAEAAEKALKDYDKKNPIHEEKVVNPENLQDVTPRERVYFEALWKAFLPNCESIRKIYNAEEIKALLDNVSSKGPSAYIRLANGQVANHNLFLYFYNLPDDELRVALQSQKDPVLKAYLESHAAQAKSLRAERERVNPVEAGIRRAEQAQGRQVNDLDRPLRRANADAKKDARPEFVGPPKPADLKTETPAPKPAAPAEPKAEAPKTPPPPTGMFNNGGGEPAKTPPPPTNMFQKSDAPKDAPKAAPAPKAEPKKDASTPGGQANLINCENAAVALAAN
jgi:hypothetical protein